MPFEEVFGGNTVYPSDPTFLALALTANAEFQWPLEQNMGGTAVLAAEIEVTPSGAGLSITLPDATLGSNGYTTTFYNAGADTFTVKDQGGNTVLTVASGEAWTMWLRNNSTVNGAWRTFQMGAGTSSANAAALAGAGLVAITTTLNEEMEVSTKSADYPIVNGDRAKSLIWDGGVGIFTLPDPTSVGTNWFVAVKNAGSGSLTINPFGSETIDGANTLILGVNEDTWLVTDGTDWFTFGFGQTNNSSFDFLSMSVAGTGDLTLSGSQLNRVSYEFTGILTGNRNIIVPASIQQYWIFNNTSGAFSLTVKCAGGVDPGTIVVQGERSILYCTGSAVVPAETLGGTTFGSGSAAAPGMAFTANPTTGFYNSAGILGISTNGVSRGTIDLEGNWNIPVPSSGADPALTVNAQFSADAGIRVQSSFSLAASTPGLVVKSSAAGGFATLSLTGNNGTVGTSDFSIFQNGATNTGNVLNRANAGLNFGANNATVLSIDTLGNFSSPSLSVSGTANAGAAALPANPVGFIIWTIAGTARKVPYYAA